MANGNGTNGFIRALALTVVGFVAMSLMAGGFKVWADNSHQNVHVERSEEQLKSLDAEQRRHTEKLIRLENMSSEMKRIADAMAAIAEKLD